MKIFIRNCLAILISGLSLVAMANPCDDGGIGGTGIVSSRGIGGTGMLLNSSNVESGGIGGTGITQKGIGGTGKAQGGIGGTGVINTPPEAQSGIGGTGIVGVITGFGSICVNYLILHIFFKLVWPNGHLT